MWNDSIASSMDPLYHAFNTHMWLLFLQEWNLIWIMFVGIYTFDGYEFYQFCWFGKAMKSSVSLKEKKKHSKWCFQLVTIEWNVYHWNV